MKRGVVPTALLLILVLGGLALLRRPAQPMPEGSQRRLALLSLAAPGGGLNQSLARPATGLGPLAPVWPTSVRLADVAAGVAPETRSFLPPEPEILSPAERRQLDDLAYQLRPFPGLQDAAAAGSRAPEPGPAFPAIDFTQAGGAVPPDPELAAGPQHVIAVVNIAFEVYDWAGNSLTGGPISFASFMASNDNCPPANASIGLFDPNALYDEAADRFLLGIDSDGAFYCLAVSKTADPLGEWWIYAFDASGTAPANLFDYPHAGVGREAIYVTGNMFWCLLGCVLGLPIESRAWALARDELYGGGPVSAVSRQVSTNDFTPQPLNLHGFAQGQWPESGPHYFLAAPFLDAQNATLYAWNDPFGANTFGPVNSLDFGAGAGATLSGGAPQQGGSNLATNDPRPQDFEFRNGYGWVSQTVSCNPGGGTVHCLRWAQVELATGAVADSGVYGSDGVHRIFPDLAVNRCGDMALGYTRTSASEFPAIYVTGRQAGEPAGTLQAEIQLKAGEIAYTAFDPAPHRWGDYTGMTIAPDGATFWYLGEYSKDTGTTNSRWGTYIGSFHYSDCSAVVLNRAQYLPAVTNP